LRRTPKRQEPAKRHTDGQRRLLTSTLSAATATLSRARVSNWTRNNYNSRESLPQTAFREQRRTGRVWTRLRMTCSYWADDSFCRASKVHTGPIRCPASVSVPRNVSQGTIFCETLVPAVGFSRRTQSPEIPSARAARGGFSVNFAQGALIYTGVAHRIKNGCGRPRGRSGVAVRSVFRVV
jgi:hypothetical protein